MTSRQIDELFKYHPPFGNQPDRYQVIRDTAKVLAKVIQRECPDSMEAEMAIRSLQQAVMWANASIAINEVAPPLTYGTVGGAMPSEIEEKVQAQLKQDRYNQGRY